MQADKPEEKEEKKARDIEKLGDGRTKKDEPPTNPRARGRETGS